MCKLRACHRLMLCRVTWLSRSEVIRYDEARPPIKDHGLPLACEVDVNESTLPSIKTPCIGVCSTGLGDDVCRGCKRFAHEVIHWNSYSEEQKRLVDTRLGVFLAQIVETRLQVTDAGLLRRQLDAQKINYSRHQSPPVWAYQLLRAGASQMGDDLEGYGLRLDAQYRGVPLVELRRQIDHEFFILSDAHYQRYFALAVERLGSVEPECL